METLKSKTIIELLQEEKIREQFNKFFSCPCWHEKVIGADFSKIDNNIKAKDLLMSYLEVINKDEGDQRCRNYFDENIKIKSYEKNSSGESNENIKKFIEFKDVVRSKNLRIYSDNAHSFKKVKMMRMQNLNDPVEGLWNYKDISYATIYINQILKSFALPLASYTTPDVGNDLYMCSNYSRNNKHFVYFKKEEYIKGLKRIRSYYGFVIYDKEKVLAMLNVLKSSLKSNDNMDAEYLEYELESRSIVYYAFEFMINMFYKWNIMQEEFEFRGVLLPFKKKTKAKSNRIGDTGMYAQKRMVLAKLITRHYKRQMFFTNWKMILENCFSTSD